MLLTLLSNQAASPLITATGTSVGTSSASGVGGLRQEATGTTTGTSTASGAADVPTVNTGASVGTSTVSGAGQVARMATGTSGGASIAFGAAGWSPRLLNPDLWLDASNPTSIVATGSAVTQWRDQSGNNNHFTGSPGTEPVTGTRTQNSRNVLDFIRGDFLDGGDILDLGTAGFSVFVVVKFDDTSNATLLGKNVFGSEDGRYGLYRSGGLIGVYDEGAGLGIVSVADASTETRLISTILTRAGGASSHIMRIAGKQVASASFTDPGFTWNIGAPWRIGRYGTNATLDHDGTVAELVFVRRVITAEEQALVEEYLEEKWAVPYTWNGTGVSAGTSTAAATATLIHAASGSVSGIVALTPPAGFSSWYDPAALALADGADVTSLTDLGPDARGFTAPGTAPKFRATGGPLGRPALDFNLSGLKPYLVTGTFSESVPNKTIGLLVNLDASQIGGYFFASTSSGNRHDILTGVNDGFAIAIHNGSLSADSSRRVFVANRWAIVIARLTAGTDEVLVDGVSVLSGNHGNTSTFTGFVLGLPHTLAIHPNRLLGRIAEAVVYKSDGVSTALHHYFRSRLYGPVNGVASVYAKASGAAAGSSAASAAGKLVATAVATAAGSSTASGAGRTTLTASGASGGTSAVAGAASITGSTTPATADLVTTRYAPHVRTPRLVTAETRAVNVATFAPTVIAPRQVTPATRALTTTTHRPVIARIAAPSSHALTLTSFPPTVILPKRAVPAHATLALTTHAVTARAPRVVTPSYSTVVVTGFAPRIARIAAPTPATLFFTLHVPIIDAAPAAPVGVFATLDSPPAAPAAYSFPADRSPLAPVAFATGNDARPAPVAAHAVPADARPATPTLITVTEV